MKRGGVRLSGGRHGGRVLTVPGHTRPTEGRVREALFAIWAAEVDGCSFLDLFAGSGAVALEAISRGALSATAVESDPRALRTLAANATRLGERAVTVRRGSLPGDLASLAAEVARFDLVFADPPYRYPAYPDLLAAVAPLLATDGELAVEHSCRRDLPLEHGGLVRVDRRRYGESCLSFYRRAAS